VARAGLKKLRLRNDLYCVEWGVKLYSLTHAGLKSQSTPVCERAVTTLSMPASLVVVVLHCRSEIMTGQLCSRRAPLDIMLLPPDIAHGVSFMRFVFAVPIRPDN